VSYAQKRASFHKAEVHGVGIFYLQADLSAAKSNRYLWLGLMTYSRMESRAPKGANRLSMAYQGRS
ncbi:hypothetical protein L1D54_24195, partial [Vibrio brasiliensis]|uniref:hypothetical protein n=1 Tax=Vibrio brasiliensis TaxID=170652 RepID=UPI001EFDAC0F